MGDGSGDGGGDGGGGESDGGGGEDGEGGVGEGGGVGGGGGEGGGGGGEGGGCGGGEGDGGGTRTFTVLRESCTLHTFTILRQNALTFTLPPPYARNVECAAFKVNVIVKSAFFSSSLSLPTLSIHVGIKPCEHTRSPRCGASHSLSDRHCRQDFAAAHHPSPQHRERERHGESGTAASHVTELPQPPSLT